MARVPTKHNRNQAPDFEGFLNNLQDWELSYKDKDKKLKSQSSSDKLKYSFSTDLSSGLGDNGRGGQSKERGSVTSQKIGIVGENGTSMRKTATSAGSASTGRQKDYLGNYDAFMTEDSSVDANSEKELGNNYFKQKKYKEAIDCYSRSLAFSPTAVAYANRAMAYLKLKRVAVVLEGEEMYALTVLLTQNDASHMKKAGTLSSIVQSQCVLIFGFQEAEDDCTEALNLDDRYIKAYSRRSTARKELGKLKGSFEDAEFALRLERQNQEIKKQYTDAKSMYDKELLKKASGALRDSTQVVQNEGKGVKGIQSVPNSSQVTRLPATQEDRVKPTSEANQSNGKKDLKASLQELAARAASLATAEAAKTITPPSSAYQFEASWRGLSGDRTLQARLLKATSPVALPQIFKNALSAPLLIDIVRCIATFFSEEVDLAVNYLDNLSKVPRFNMIIMCLSSADKADVQKIWDETFCSEGTSPKYSEILCKLRSRYCNKL